MVITAADMLNMQIVSGNFTTKCLVELLRQVTDFEIYHAAEKMRKAGFTETNNAIMKAEIQHITTTLGFITDYFKDEKKLQEEPTPPNDVPVDKKPVVM
jgi:hypothetical protein